MNQVPNTRINAVEQIEVALKMLTSYGYNTAPIWHEHAEWLDSVDGTGEINDDVRRYAENAKVTPIADHFVDGEIEVLSAAHVVVGHQYTLSSGQRDILRERYGLTPTSVVVVTDLGFFRGTQYISSITIKSAQHVDPRIRTRVLNEVVLRPAWQFFRDSAAKDKAREDEAAAKEEIVRVSKPKSATSIALQYV